MATSKDLEIHASLFIDSIGDLSISILIKLIDSINFHPIFSQCTSLIKTHDFQTGRLDSLLGIGTQHIIPLQSHQAERVDQVEIYGTTRWEGLCDYQ